MPEPEIDLDPVDALTIGVAGEPGHRTFFLEGWSGARSCTLLVEKVQVQELGRRLLQVLGESGERRPAPDPRTDPDGPPGWRVGNIQVAIDEALPRCVLVVEELDLTAIDEDEEPDEADEADAPPLRSARFAADLGQMRGLAARALEVVEGGRPICPLCQRPIDPGGHVCPASNGHLHR